MDTLRNIALPYRTMPFEPYAPVRDQIRILLRAVNRKRKVAGLELVPWDAPRHRLASLAPFGAPLPRRPNYRLIQSHPPPC
jgi:hypothetical protein